MEECIEKATTFGLMRRRSPRPELSDLAQCAADLAVGVADVDSQGLPSSLCPVTRASSAPRGTGRELVTTGDSFS